MYIRKLRWILRTVGVGFCLTALFVVLYCCFSSCDVSPTTASSNTVSSNGSKNPAAGAARPLPSLKQFEAFWLRPLRRPLVDPPPAKPAEEQAMAPKRPPPNVRLLGIAVESGHSLAMFATPQGTVELKGIGDTLGETPNGPQVASIEDQKVVLRYLGETITVALENEKAR